MEENKESMLGEGCNCNNEYMVVGSSNFIDGEFGDYCSSKKMKSIIWYCSRKSQFA